MMSYKPEKQITLKEIKQNNDSGLFISIAEWITKTSKEKLTLRGTAEQVATVQAAMVATRDFHESLHSDSADVNVIAEKLEVKHQAAAAFERMFGVSWIL